ncbi:MAG: hypothetical protein WCT04_05260 [Planctomycetota bacterium]
MVIIVVLMYRDVNLLRRDLDAINAQRMLSESLQTDFANKLSAVEAELARTASALAAAQAQLLAQERHRQTNAEIAVAPAAGQPPHKSVTDGAFYRNGGWPLARVPRTSTLVLAVGRSINPWLEVLL